MEIAKCKADQNNDPGYCERFWKDYGNAMRGRGRLGFPFAGMSIFTALVRRTGIFFIIRSMP
jgi:hypothetical protein